MIHFHGCMHTNQSKSHFRYDRRILLIPAQTEKLWGFRVLVNFFMHAACILILFLVPLVAASQQHLESPAARFIQDAIFSSAHFAPRYQLLDVPSPQFRSCTVVKAFFSAILLTFSLSFPYVQGTGFVAHTSMVLPLSTATLSFVLIGACCVTE